MDPLKDIIKEIQRISQSSSISKRAKPTILDTPHLWRVCHPCGIFLCLMIGTSNNVLQVNHCIKFNTEFYHKVVWWLAYLPNGNEVNFLYKQCGWHVIMVNISPLMPVILSSVVISMDTGAKEPTLLGFQGPKMSFN